MKEKPQAIMKNGEIHRVVAAGAALLLSLGCLSLQAQQAGSLADAARQARADKQAQPKADASKAQRLIDDMVDAEDGGSAPAGFKLYKADGYNVLVPAPNRVATRDGAGALLAGVQTGATRLYVLVGNPLVAKGGNSDDAFHDAAVQYVRVYAPSANCTKSTVIGHPAYQCGLAGAKMDNTSVSGSAEFVKSGDRIYPVFCAAKTDSDARDTFNNPRVSLELRLSAQAAMAREDAQVRTAWQKCETILQSVQITETTSLAAETPAVSPAKPARVAPIRAAPAAQALPSASAGATPGTSVPAGFKVQPFNYCKSANNCWNASVAVPADAQLMSSDCKQFVFQTKVQGAPFLLLAGSTGGEGCGGRSQSDPNMVRWNELAQPESARAPGTFNTISTLQATLDGKPAIITQIGFRKGLTEWRGKRAEVESNGVPLVVGCISPKDSFAGGDEICSGLIASLRLQ